MRKCIISSLALIFIMAGSLAQPVLVDQEKIITGAQRTEAYFPLLADKSWDSSATTPRSSASTHLVDTLLSCRRQAGSHIQPGARVPGRRRRRG